MNKPVFFAFLTFLLQACGDVTSEQIEGISWTDNYSKLGGSQAYTGFSEGKVLSCSESEKQWLIIALYEIKGSTIIIKPMGKNKEKKSFTVSVKGTGDNRVLTMSSGEGEKQREMTFPVSTSNACPLG